MGRPEGYAELDHPDWFVCKRPEDGKWLIIYRPHDIAQGPVFDSKDEALKFYKQNRTLLTTKGITHS